MPTLQKCHSALNHGIEDDIRHIDLVIFESTALIGSGSPIYSAGWKRNGVVMEEGIVIEGRTKEVAARQGGAGRGLNMADILPPGIDLPNIHAFAAGQIIRHESDRFSLRARVPLTLGKRSFDVTEDHVFAACSAINLGKREDQSAVVNKGVLDQIKEKTNCVRGGFCRDRTQYDGCCRRGEDKKRESS